jgi:hypothetical protein
MSPSGASMYERVLRPATSTAHTASMNRKYEGMLTTLFIAASLVGCKRSEPEQEISQREPQEPVANSPLGPITGKPNPNPPTASGTVPGTAGVPSAGPASGLSGLSSPPRVSAGPRPPESFRNGPPTPPRPKADEVVTGKYTAPGGSTAEIEGVCRVTEDSVSCWDPNGARNADLEKRVEEGLTRDNGMGGRNVSFAYKKKNRVVVVKTTHPSNQMGIRSGYMNLMSVGDTMYGGGGYINLSDFGNSSYQPGQPRVDYQARSVAVDPSARTTSAYFGVTEQSPKQGTLELRKGASCSIEDAGLTVVSIKKGTVVPGMNGNMYGGFMGSRDSAAWTIEVKQKSYASKYRLSLHANMAYVDAKGNVVSSDSYQKAMAKMMEEQMKAQREGKPYARPPEPQMRMVMFQQMGGGPDRFYYLVNANPEVLKQVSVTASRTRQIELKGIRLDPR